MEYLQAVGRLGGKHIFDECTELQIKILEQSTVPWNIRVQISGVLEEWKMNNSNFVQTRAANYVLKCVQENSCVTITGSSGVGKTATLQHVALQMADDGYNVILITDSHDIVKFYNPNQKTLFVIDDFCGTYSMNMSYLNSLETVIDRIKGLILNENTKIFLACRLQVYQDDKFETLSIFRKCVCNLLSNELCLSQTEKQSIAELYLDTRASEIIQYCDLYDCFPLLCKLYHENSGVSITDFFNNPFSVYETEIDKLHKNKHFGKYCALALCVVFNNSLKVEWLTGEVDTLTKMMIEETCEACRLDRCTSRLILLDELKSLEHTFIKKEQGIFKTIHDKIFDFLTYYFGQKMVQCLIRYSQIEVIMQRFLLERKDDMDQFITVVPPGYHEMYLYRMICEWLIGNVRIVFNNINMKILEFRQRFFCFLNALDISVQIALAHVCDVIYKDTALLHCCQYNDIPWIEWCFYHDVDVNKCNLHGISPLHLAAHSGALEVVKLLISKADLNIRTDNGGSPFLFAIQNNHLEVVKVLLENEADIDMCDNDGLSPLYTACKENNIKIVKLLLDNKANVNTCLDDGSTSLMIASSMNSSLSLQHCNTKVSIVEKTV
ncbi:Hypothetical predicted protein [Mytilus galloprovincialis]|uniref:Novel STAND NTPase 3 domain-containing protein n=1 Tax=Mytilus galloprovincialis TaxID=29158 RepID=A0A8B6H2D0_MYTGA|nr:Hypothetical predicted protein [Mytilus galloprovincialis]